jgi:ADP-heptose:LPS heptosyltransferase
VRRLERLLILGHDCKVGDICIWQSVLEAIHKLSPETRVTWISHSGVRKIVEGHPTVEGFWDFPANLRPLTQVRLLRRLKRLKPDAVLLLQNNTSRPWARLMFLARVPIRVGAVTFKKKGRHLTHNIFDSSLEWHLRHSGRKALDMLGLALDAPVPDIASKIVFTPGVVEEVKACVDGFRLPPNFFVLQLGTGGSNLVVNPKFYSSVVSRVVDELKVLPVLTGVDSELPLQQAFIESYGRPAVSLVGKTEIAVLAEVARRAKFVLSVDTAIVHIAAAVGTQSIVLMPKLAVDPSQWAPWCVPSIVIRPKAFCAACSAWKCKVGEMTCTQSFLEEEVFEACRTMLNRDGPSPSSTFAGAQGSAFDYV